MELIEQLRQKRNELWEETKLYLKYHLDEDGLIRPQFLPIYDEMATMVKMMGTVINWLEERERNEYNE